MRSRHAKVVAAALVVYAGLALAGPIATQPESAGGLIRHGVAVGVVTTAAPANVSLGKIHAAGLGGAPITFTLTGTGTGTVGSTPFTNAAFTLTLTSNTGSIINEGSGVYATPDTTTTLQIAGFPLATFTDAIAVFSNTSTDEAGFSDETQFLDICDIGSSSFAAYDLTTAIGPVSSPTFAFVGTSRSFATSIGSLTLTSASNGTFTATLGNGTGIPAASSVALAILALALAACGVLVLRRLA